MAESSYDYLLNRDKKEQEDKPWLEFNYDETVTPETLFDKIKKATHKLNIKGVLETITSNSNSKLNSRTSQKTSPDRVVPDNLTVTTIKTGEEQNIEKNDEYSKD